MNLSIFDHIKLAVLLAVLVAEDGLLVGEINLSPVDPGVLDDGGDVEDVLIGDDEGCLFAGFD